MNPLLPSDEKKYIPLSLMSFQTLLVGIFHPNGDVLESNAGFRTLQSDDHSKEGWNCSECFVNPTLAQLKTTATPATDQAPIYQGVLTLCFPGHQYQSVEAMVFLQDGLFFLVAEYNVEELGQLNTQVTALNDELTRMQRELVRSNHKLEEQRELYRMASITDVLTGLYNRRHFIESLTEEMERCDRFNKALSLILCDIDHFKRVNDTYGHDQGDAVLCAFSALIKKELRSYDVAARFGGEEFVILLPESDLDQAAVIAERLRDIVATHKDDALATSVTASFGVAQYIKDETEDELIKRADLALYQAKTNGRNRISTSTD
ncbi:MAG: GGDEF domain-containing protein [Sedimenticola sp.]|nr:GGDEF domain-containing protein [Sedimenticola sp.]